MCCKCSKWLGAVVFIVGILFLLGDFGIWPFWGISWWTAAFILAGVGMFGMGSCHACCMEEAEEEKPKKK